MKLSGHSGGAGWDCRRAGARLHTAPSTAASQRRLTLHNSVAVLQPLLVLGLCGRQPGVRQLRQPRLGAAQQGAAALQRGARSGLELRGLLLPRCRQRAPLRGHKVLHVPNAEV